MNVIINKTFIIKLAFNEAKFTLNLFSLQT